VTGLIRVGVLLALLVLALPSVAGAKPRPSLSARAAILIEPSSGEIIYARNPYTRREIASTTKMMTALLLLERRSLGHRIKVVNYNAGAGESTAGLIPGERLTSADMLRALLLPSANEAAASIAVDVGGSRKGFVRMMNARAKRAGLRRTHFSNPDGLDGRRNYSTARDLATLGVLLRGNSFARRLVDRSQAKLRSGYRSRTVYNRNTLIGAVPWMNGIKTGHTSSAGYLLVGGASRNGAELISVVMGEPSEAARNDDTLKLMRYGFGRYRSVRAVTKGQRFATLDVEGRDATVGLIASRSADVVMRTAERPTTIVSGLPDRLTGPLAKGARVGEVIVLRRGKSVERIALVTATAVAAPSLLATAGGLAGPAAGLFVALILIAISATLLRKRRRRRRPERAQRRPA
jgi:D-alanyl-D-alanine carboxypeptidase (penicillin-binding protein 5/6)